MINGEENTAIAIENLSKKKKKNFFSRKIAAFQIKIYFVYNGRTIEELAYFIKFRAFASSSSSRIFDEENADGF